MLVGGENADRALLVRIAASKAAPGVDVRIIEDGLDALAYLQGREPYADRSAHPFRDLVLLDPVMPRLDGEVVA